MAGINDIQLQIIYYQNKYIYNINWLYLLPCIFTMYTSDK